MAGELLDAGAVIVPRREVNRGIKERTGAEGIDHDAVRSGFESAGWGYSRHLYFHEGRLRERASAVSNELRSVNHLVVTEEEVMDRIVAPVDCNGEEGEPLERGGETGWREGRAVAILREVFEAEGWLVRDLERASASRVFYLLPLYGVIRDLHPNGRPPFSTDDVFRYYVSQSIRGTVGRD